MLKFCNRDKWIDFFSVQAIIFAIGRTSSAND